MLQKSSKLVAILAVTAVVDGPIDYALMGGVGLIFGLSCALFGGLVFGLIYGLAGALAGGLVMGLIGGFGFGSAYLFSVRPFFRYASRHPDGFLDALTSGFGIGFAAGLVMGLALLNGRHTGGLYGRFYKRIIAGTLV